MNIEQLRLFCLSMPNVTEDFPFDENVLAFKVLSKIFVLTNIYSDPFEVNLKCEPERAIELREKYAEIRPGYHMNKKHWNTVNFDGDLTDAFLEGLIRHSYEMVVEKMPARDKKTLMDG